MFVDREHSKEQHDRSGPRFVYRLHLLYGCQDTVEVRADVRVPLLSAFQTKIN